MTRAASATLSAGGVPPLRRLRRRPLIALAAIKGRAIPHLEAGLNDADSDVRCFAIRLCRMMHATRGLDTTPLDSDPVLVVRSRDGGRHRLHVVARLAHRHRRARDAEHFDVRLGIAERDDLVARGDAVGVGEDLGPSSNRVL